MSLKAPNEIPGPVKLLESPPYTVTVTTDEDAVIVESSHRASIKYLHDYLKHHFGYQEFGRSPHRVIYIKKGKLVAIRIILDDDRVAAARLAIKVLEDAIGYTQVWSSTWTSGKHNQVETTRWDLRRETELPDWTCCDS